MCFDLFHLKSAVLQAVRMCVCVGGGEGCVARFSNKEEDHNNKVKDVAVLGGRVFTEVTQVKRRPWGGPSVIL